MHVHQKCQTMHDVFCVHYPCKVVAPALLESPPLSTRYKGTVAMSRIPDGRELQVVYCEGVSVDGHQKTERSGL